MVNKKDVGKGAESFTVCSNCYYDLTIKIYDDCNTRIDSITEPIKIGSDSVDCNNLGLQSGKLDVDFAKVGEYSISFEFAFNRKVIDNFTQEYISKGQNCKTIKREFDFIKVYLDSLDLSGLFSDCRNCKEALGTKSIFTKRVTSTVLALEVDSSSVMNPDFIAWAGTKYDGLITNCERLQDSCLLNASPCERYEILMSMDIIPGGQFSLYDEDGTALEPQLNILDRYWRTEFPSSDPESDLYKSELITLEDGSTTSPYAADFDAKKMIAFWKQEWALKFLKYHPEFCKLQFCRSNTTYYSWDIRVKDKITKANQISSIPGAGNLTYDTNNGAWLLAADPFFKTTGPGRDYLAAMQADLQSYSQNVLAISSPQAQVKGLSQFVDYMLYCANPAGTANTTKSDNSWNTCTPDNNCRVPDREWVYYRDSYFELKEKYYKAVRDNGPCKDACLTGTPLSLAAPGILTTKDFVIRGEDDSEGCNDNEMKLSVSYKEGAVRIPVTVEIYIPASETMVLQFNPGDSKKVFCVRRGYPKSIIKVSGVKQ